MATTTTLGRITAAVSAARIAGRKRANEREPGHHGCFSAQAPRRVQIGSCGGEGPRVGSCASMSKKRPANEHAIIKTAYGEMTLAFWPSRSRQDGRELQKARARGILRRDGVSPHHQGLHDSGAAQHQAGARGIPGTGDPGYKVKAKFNAPSPRQASSRWRSSHPDSAGSQFFIVHGDALPRQPIHRLWRAREGRGCRQKLASVPTKAVGGEKEHAGRARGRRASPSSPRDFQVEPGAATRAPCQSGGRARPTVSQGAKAGRFRAAGASPGSPPRGRRRRSGAHQRRPRRGGLALVREPASPACHGEARHAASRQRLHRARCAGRATRREGRVPATPRASSKACAAVSRLIASVSRRLRLQRAARANATHDPAVPPLPGGEPFQPRAAHSDAAQPEFHGAEARLDQGGCPATQRASFPQERGSPASGVARPCREAGEAFVGGHDAKARGRERAEIRGGCIQASGSKAAGQPRPNKPGRRHRRLWNAR